MQFSQSFLQGSTVTKNGLNLIENEMQKTFGCGIIKDDFVLLFTASCHLLKFDYISISHKRQDLSK